MKEQEKSPEKNPKETVISNMRGQEFKENHKDAH